MFCLLKGFAFSYLFMPPCVYEKLFKWYFRRLKHNAFRHRFVDSHADRKGTAVLYDTVSETVCNMRASAPVSSEWSSDIKKDFESRK